MHLNFYGYKLDQRLLRHLDYRGLSYLAEEKKIVFKYEIYNQKNDVDIRALTEGLGKYCELLHLISNELRDDAVLNIRVEAVSPGSFEVWIRLCELGQGVLGTLQATGILGSIESILFIFKELFKLKDFLGSEKADRIEATDGSNANVVNGNSNIIFNQTTINLYKGTGEVSSLLAEASRAVLSDRQIRSVKIQEEKDGIRSDLIDLGRDRLDRMTEPNSYLIEETQTIIKENVEMTLTGLHLEFRGVWRFDYNDRKITAKIKDDDFILKVKNREIMFAHGDIFVVDLKVIQERKPGTPYWMDKDFTIMKVKEIKHLEERETGIQSIPEFNFE